MTALTQVVAGLVAGTTAGLVFFGGLAATVRRLPDSTRPAALVVGSVLGRFVVLAVILVGLAQWGAMALLPGSVAVIVVRTVLVRREAGGGSATAKEPGGDAWT